LCWTAGEWAGAASAATSPTTVDSGVITIVGGPDATARIVGPHNDPADLYGIVLVLAAIAVALFATRWIFGRGRTGSR